MRVKRKNNITVEELIAYIESRCVEVGSCLVWTGGRLSSNSGYGVISYMSVRYLVHRFVYELRHSVTLHIEEKVCHTCDNGLCLRDEHHFVGSQLDNMFDMVRKDRSAFGDRSPKCKLSDRQVVLIRELKQRGVSNKDIADRFGVHNATVSRISRLLRRTRVAGGVG